MSTKFEIRGLLAKLLSTENILVEHKAVETASFDVLNRVLTLPLFEKASDDVYTLLILHEISHANFTPVDDVFTDSEIPNSFINITEDARVEKLCKRKYAGSPKYFYKGYKELYDMDFFEIENQDVSSFNLADRANLYFKVGNFMKINFTSREQEIIDIISNAETFDDAVDAARILYEYCKSSDQEFQPDNSFGNQIQQGSFGDENQEKTKETDDTQPSGDENQDSNSRPNQMNPDDGHINSSSNPVNSNPNPNPTPTSSKEEPKAHTAESLEKNIKNLSNRNGDDIAYVELPNLNLDTVIAKNSEVHSEIKRSFFNETKVDVFKGADNAFYKFKKSAQKEVNYLIKEFECKKAADSYARITTSKTGSLDSSKLYSYKFNDDLFKKIAVVPDGKNHGLIFILDWSGSMQHVLLDTCKQLYNLIWFCRKTSIPFDVYAFTNEWRSYYNYNKNTGSYGQVDVSPHYTSRSGVFYVDRTFSLMNILTSQVSSRVLDEQMLNIWRIALAYKTSAYSYSIPQRLGLSGTPLNESMIALHSIIPQFQEKTKAQKVHCVILTDGEAASIPYHVNVKRRRSDDSFYDYIGTKHIYLNKTFLRDRSLGTTYKFEGDHGNYHKITEVFIRNLRDKFPDVSFIGIRLLSSRDASRFISNFYTGEQYSKIMEYWRANKSFAILNSGYHSYFGMQSNSISDNDDFEVAEDSSLSKIKNAFTKSLKVKKFNKKILGDFVSLIA